MRWKVAILMASAAVAAAQTPNGSGIWQGMKQNAEALKRYSYKRRIEIQVKDKSLGARVDLVRFAGGQMEVVPVETPSRPDAPSRRRGLRGKMVEGKIEQKKQEMKEERERLEKLLHSYLSPGSDSMRGMLEKATISRTGSGADAEVKVVATGLMKATDSFSLVWSVVNRRPVSIEIRSEMDGKPVRLRLEYAGLREGHFYAARTVISAPNKKLVIRIDTFDYSLAGESK